MSVLDTIKHSLCNNILTFGNDVLQRIACIALLVDTFYPNFAAVVVYLWSAWTCDECTWHHETFLVQLYYIDTWQWRCTALLGPTLDDPTLLLCVAEFDHLTRHPVRVEQDGVEVSMTLVDTCGLVSRSLTTPVPGERIICAKLKPGERIICAKLKHGERIICAKLKPGERICAKLKPDQTHKRFKRMLFIRIKHNMRIFGTVPFIKQ